ncbi:hypothetical protein [Luteolibacter sp. LG18]|uniref:hypothetical protein n=1 Tax=Luteolibacter sp. LG18 TaxID=2819286 RepID=UPI002B2BC829|nr:hypothetical protein llg_29420 [Luteolibacter sp. LG18]
MKSSLVPGFCGLALASMVAIGGQHWWTVHQQVTAWQAEHAPEVVVTPPVSKPAPAPAPEVPKAKPTAPAQELAARPAPAAPAQGPVNTTSAPAKEFFQGMLEELKSLKQENRDLRDQVAETNRDLMEMQFRLDTHSQSFRPLKLKNDEPSATRDAGPSVLDPLPRQDNGVLPPRAVVPADELPVQ